MIFVNWDKCPEKPFLKFFGHFIFSELKHGHSQNIRKDTTTSDKPCRDLFLKETELFKYFKRKGIIF